MPGMTRAATAQRAENALLARPRQAAFLTVRVMSPVRGSPVFAVALTPVAIILAAFSIGSPGQPCGQHASPPVGVRAGAHRLGAKRLTSG
jgi:hypothetical protein